MGMMDPKPLYAGKEIENVLEDFKSARKVDKYRVSDLAIYIPAGFGWKYLRFADVTEAHPAKQNAGAPHTCIAVNYVLPAIALMAEGEKTYLELDKKESQEWLLKRLAGE